MHAAPRVWAITIIIIIIIIIVITHKIIISINIINYLNYGSINHGTRVKGHCVVLCSVFDIM